MKTTLRGFRSKRLASIVVATCWVLAISFAHARIVDAHQNATPDIVSIQAAIELNNKSYFAALKDRDAPRFASLFAEDAISLPHAGRAISGRANIEASILAAFQRVRFVQGSMHTENLQLSAGNAVEIGSYAYAIVTDGVPEELHGRYLTMWRFIDGLWKIEVDSSQPDAPPPDHGAANDATIAPL